MIVKDIKVGDICIYVGSGSLPEKFIGDEFEVTYVKGYDLMIQKNNKKYLVDYKEIKVIRRPIIKQKFTKEDPYGEEKWEDDEMVDVEYKRSKIQKFKDMFNGGDDLSDVWMNRQINNIVGY